MMTVDANKRIDASEILEHPWIKKYVVKQVGETPMSDVVIKNLKAFKGRSILNSQIFKLVLILIVWLMVTDITILKFNISNVCWFKSA